MEKKPLSIAEQIRSQVLPVLQKTSVFRPVVVFVILAAGLGGAGLPLYFKMEDLNNQYVQEKSKYDLLQANAAIRETLKVYQDRMSAKTEFLQWVSDLRELSDENGVSISGISPTLVLKPDRGVQKLQITAVFTGRFADLVRLLGIMQNRREKIHVADIGINSGITGKCTMNLSMSMLLLVPADRKKPAARQEARPPAPAQEKPAEKPAEKAVQSPAAPAKAPDKQPAAPGSSAPEARKPFPARFADDDAALPPVAAPQAPPAPAKPERGAKKTVPAKFAVDEPPPKPAAQTPGSGRQSIVAEESQ